jgi:hypothetical protein
MSSVENKQPDQPAKSPGTMWSKFTSTVSTAGSTASASAKSSMGSVKNTIGDSMASSPQATKVATENRLNIETGAVETMNCEVYVSCDVGKQIRSKLADQLKSAADEFSLALNGLEKPTNKISDLYGFAEKAKTKVDTVKKAHSVYEQKMGAVIKLDTPLDCKIAVKNAVDESGNIVAKVNGKITEINPKAKTFKVEGSALKKVSTGTKEIKISDNLPISSLCVGGADADSNATAQCFEQAGGKNAYKFKSANSANSVSSDIGICE